MLMALHRRRAECVRRPSTSSEAPPRRSDSWRSVVRSVPRLRGGDGRSDPTLRGRRQPAMRRPSDPIRSRWCRRAGRLAVDELLSGAGVAPSEHQTEILRSDLAGEPDLGRERTHPPPGALAPTRVVVLRRPRPRRCHLARSRRKESNVQHAHLSTRSLRDRASRCVVRGIPSPGRCIARSPVWTPYAILSTPCSASGSL